MEKLIKNFGNLLIIAAAGLLLYIYYPLLMLYLKPTTIASTLPSQGYFLTIPKISAQSPIIQDVDPWDQSVYRRALEQGVAAAKGSITPPNSGLTYLFAHSSDSPWRITRYNTVFFRLPELQPGDLITLTKDGQPYNYRVRTKQEVWPNQTEFLKDSSSNQLVLQTCVPIGTALKRLLIFAEPLPTPTKNPTSV